MEDKINFLSELGVDIWWPRATRHPRFSRENIKIEILPLQMHARCLVLLPMNFSYTKESQALECQVLEWQELLDKMLCVLELDECELVIAKIYSEHATLSTDDWQQVAVTISQWQPRLVLQFAPELPLCMGGLGGVTTFHPQHLLECPQDKAIAYQDLLKLKTMLKAS